MVLLAVLRMVKGNGVLKKLLDTGRALEAHFAKALVRARPKARLALLWAEQLGRDHRPKVLEGLAEVCVIPVARHSEAHDVEGAAGCVPSRGRRGRGSWGRRGRGSGSSRVCTERRGRHGPRRDDRVLVRAGDPE
eukprot:2395305-Prymnesium_polylepis.1